LRNPEIKVVQASCLHSLSELNTQQLNSQRLTVNG
jgi:hypothetical protein